MVNWVACWLLRNSSQKPAPQWMHVVACWIVIWLVRMGSWSPLIKWWHPHLVRMGSWPPLIAVNARSACRIVTWRVRMGSWTPPNRMVEPTPSENGVLTTPNQTATSRHSENGVLTPLIKQQLKSGKSQLYNDCTIMSVLKKKDLKSHEVTR